MFSDPTPFTPPTTGDELSFVRLVRSRRVGPAGFRKLLRDYGDPETALAQLPDLARRAGADGYAPCSIAQARAEIAAGKRFGARLLLLGQADYPRALTPFEDAPPLLWALGDIELLARPAIAVVGARNASSMGLRMAARLAQDLGRTGFVVASGMARGVDAAAHEASLASGTIAVQAGGIDVVYPTENAALARDIAARGLRLAELPPGIAPRAGHFPQRNRIIAGLALATVVVEAAARSGSIGTARQALDYGREVMAVPGHPVDPRAAGCNALIRDGAVLIRGANDIVEAIGRPTAPDAGPAGAAADDQPARRPAPASQAAPAARPAREDVPDASRDAAARRAAPPDPRVDAVPARARPFSLTTLRDRILSALSPTPTPEDNLIHDLGTDPVSLAPELLALELDGRVTRHPGGRISAP